MAVPGFRHASCIARDLGGGDGGAGGQVSAQQALDLGHQGTKLGSLGGAGGAQGLDLGLQRLAHGLDRIVAFGRGFDQRAVGGRKLVIGRGKADGLIGHVILSQTLGQRIDLRLRRLKLGPEIRARAGGDHAAAVKELVYAVQGGTEAAFADRDIAHRRSFRGVPLVVALRLPHDKPADLARRTPRPIRRATKGSLMREATITRTTAETQIEVALNLDGTGVYDNQTGVGFFDHMLDQLSRHSLIDLTIRAKGDLHVDDHHTVEDTGIAIGQALVRALGDKKGIRRYGSFLLAMDDSLVRAALDLSARPFLVWNVDFPTEKIGSFDTQLVREFFQALSTHGGITLHVDRIHGINSHHIAEAAFKAVARALREAVEPDPRMAGVLPSTKGAL